MGYICQILRGILGKTLGDTMRFICQKLWDIFAQTMGYIMEYFCQKLWDICGKTKGLLGKTMGNIIGYIWQYVLNNWIY